MIRTCSAKLVDAIVNHPSIRPTIELGTYRIDSSDLLSDDGTVIYASEDGVVIFIPKGWGIYEGHMAFLPWGRGKVMLSHCRAALDGIFGDFGAEKVTAAVPMQLPAARISCRLLGFASHGPDEAGTSEIFTLEREAYGRDH